MIIRKETEHFEQMVTDYISHTFGVYPHKDIKHIRSGISGNFEVKPDFNIIDDNPDKNYSFENLLYEGELAATNDPRELIAHKHFLEKANGRILVSGLGLGNSLHELLKNEAVSFIRVIEKEQDVIDLVAPFFDDPRVKIICDDVFEYGINEHFDIIYHAIWKTENEVKQDIATRKALSEKYGSFCSWQGFMYIQPKG